MIKEEYAKLLKEAELEYESNKKLIMTLKKVRAKSLDREFNMLNDRAFEEIDCLECGNCCRHTGPRFQKKDVIKLAKRFRCRTVAFQNEFLMVDEEDDLVFKHIPCKFLADDNYCIYYEDRPKGCHDFPYTHKTRLRNYLRETMENTKICPAVYLMVKWLKESLVKGELR